MNMSLKVSFMGQPLWEGSLQGLPGLTGIGLADQAQAAFTIEQAINSNTIFRAQVAIDPEGGVKGRPLTDEEKASVKDLFAKVDYARLGTRLMGTVAGGPVVTGRHSCASRDHLPEQASRDHDIERAQDLSVPDRFDGE
jgi:hypothetical protein